MKEIKTLKPGCGDDFYEQITEVVFKGAVEMLDPCKDHGRTHLANIVGPNFDAQHKIMLDIASGIKPMAKTPDEQLHFGLACAISQLLVMAMLQLIADPNTQWSDDELFYDQLENQLKILASTAMTAKVIEKG